MLHLHICYKSTISHSSIDIFRCMMTFRITYRCTKNNRNCWGFWL